MERSIGGFHQDDQGDWVAELSCGHNQHVRHRPPFQERPWVVEADGRAGRIGSPIDCPLCDRAELPAAARYVRSTPLWTDLTMPAGLRRGHRVAPRTWGLIRVTEGAIQFSARTEPPIHAAVRAGESQPIPPDVEHEVATDGPVLFSIDFLTVEPQQESTPHQGGDPACWAHLVCVECGSVVGPGPHRPGCRLAES